MRFAEWNGKLLANPFNWFERSLRNFYWSKYRIAFVSLKHDLWIEPFALLYNDIASETEILQTKPEAYLIYSAALMAAAKLDGDMAEGGVFKGGTAKLICEAKGPKELHLFDTWGGLPEGSSDGLNKGDFYASLEETKRFLSQYSNVHFYRGVFPETAKAVEGRRFCFVSLDFDLFKPTFAALGFFYPRMVPGGIIVCHNYKNFSGIRKAFDEFFAGKSEIVLALNYSQCLVQKCGGLKENE